MKLTSLYCKRAMPAGVATAMLLLGACTSKTPSSNGAPAPASTAASRKAPPTSVVASAAGAPAQSVFSVGESARDPFFPMAKKAVIAQSTGQVEVPIDVPSVLQANFQGVITSGGKAIAVINNVMIEAGRTAVIPIRAGSQQRQVAVRCQEVSHEVVVLEVQGYAQPVRIIPKTL